MSKAQNISHSAKSGKTQFINRCLAKFIDFLIAGALSQLVRFWGPLAGLTYILISDGLPGGKSLGKRLIGLRVVENEKNLPCDYIKSILRNLPIGLVFLFAIIPFIGWLLFITVGLLIIVFECYLMFTEEGGARIGDILADTTVKGEEK